MDKNFEFTLATEDVNSKLLSTFYENHCTFSGRNRLFFSIALNVETCGNIGTPYARR